MNYGLVSQDLHVAVIPEVTVEFEIVDDGSEVADVEQHVQSSISSVNHLTSSDKTDNQVNEVDGEPSPMDKEEFAYPSNLTSDLIVLDDEEQSYSEQENYASSPTSPSGSTRFELSKDLADSDSNFLEGDELIVKRGHSRALNPSSGSDLIQVSVEDLLISEEINRTIKSSKSNRKHGQQEQEQDNQSQSPLRATPSSSSSSSSSKTMTTITATIHATGERARSIVFDQDFTLGTNKQQQDQERHDPENQTHKKVGQARRVSCPPAPKILTPAQQREVEADDNIQKAIELHENNQLEEATHYFKLAAQSENPLGQLMYGLSLRHGWGCKPNPAEAIVYLQRAAEYAMGEMNELHPIAITASPHPTVTSNTQLSSLSPPLSPQTTLDEKPSGANGGATNVSSNKQPASHQTLRRMGSMDRKEAMVMARKELVMALYELGMSYLKGWGVVKDKTVGFTYFKIAADLGDADSQNETALCYYEGIGVEKDMYESARYYRMAASQGATQLGNSWIWKPKYDQYCAAESAGVAVAAGIKKAHDKPKRLATAIHTAFHGSSTTSKSGGSSSSPPISPSTTSSRYSMSSIASGLASVTATTAGAAASPSYGNTIRQSLASPPSTPPVSTSASAPISSRSRSMSTASAGTGATSLASSVSPIASLGSSSASKSILTASASSPTTPTASSPSVTSNATGELEKKKNRWTMWGGLRSTTSPAVATSQQ
ncbi:hypothetical protein BGX26_011247 [Mortierella sp. AD094]|nr:hypothetical protein BGX26_011247 [Mortierella sp. AD094]